LLQALLVTECLDDTTTFEFVEGTLDARAEAAVKAHIASCDECRVLVSQTAKSMREPADGEGEADAMPRGGVIGRYRVIDVIGAGAMGVVYSAYDPELDRRVAMKLLKNNLDAPEETAELQQRLSREARAMARLSHENVVAVYDTGTFEGRVFLAMELVDGVALSAWLAASPRSWHEVLAVYVSAGRGLAAAHDAGLVHRDFKPDNVLVGADGRVRVTDFGLARAVVRPESLRPPPYPSGTHRAAKPGQGPVAETHAGVIAGTPAYMAPEQLLGKPADGRSDQFSFAVALSEALYGQRPFAGSSIEELRIAIESQRIREPPRDTRVPAWLRQALARGLKSDPAQRYPTMADFLASLERRTWRLRRRVFIPAAIALALLTALLGYRLAPHEPAAVCKGAEARLVGVWDAPRRHDSEAAFRATNAPYALDAWRVSAGVLDGYVRAWTAMRTDACEATRVRAEQSEEVLELRVGCLDDRLRTVAAVTKLFATADREVAVHAVEAVQSLPPVETCANVDALRSGLRPPKDAATAKGVAEVRSQIAEASALERAGKYKDALAVATSTVARARALTYLPVEAEALLELGSIEGGLDDSKATLATLEEAAAVAEAASHHEVAARAWTDLAYFIGYRENHLDQGDRWLRYAALAIERIGGNEELEADRVERLGLLDWMRGKPDDAMKNLERARQLSAKHPGTGDAIVAKAVDAMALVEFDLGHYEASIEKDTQAIAIDEKAYGAIHPAVAIDLNNRANALQRLDRYEDALVDVQRSLDILERTLGAEHPDTFLVLDSMGSILASLGKHEEALLALKRARSVLEHAGKGALPDYASVLNDIGQTERELHAYDEAVAAHRQALGVLEAALGPAHADVAMTHRAIAEVWLAERKFAQAREEAKRAMPDLDTPVGGEASNTAKVLTVLGEATLGVGDVKGARAILERALLAREKLIGEAPDLARARFALARALERDGEAPRALALARQARETYAAKPYFKDKLALVDGWLKAHGGP
jgi:tetratricopeptide (TPR) repeat protein